MRDRRPARRRRAAARPPTAAAARRRRARRPRARRRRRRGGRRGSRSARCRAPPRRAAARRRAACPASSASSSTHDPAVVGAEVDLVLGEDHPLRHLAAQLAPLERQPVRQRRARAAPPRPSRRRRSSTRRRRSEYGSASPTSTVRELQPVGVRMLLRLEHVADAEERRGRRGTPTPLDAVHLGGRRSRGARRSASAVASTRTYSRSQLSGTLIRTASGSAGRSPRTAGCRGCP